MKYKIFHECFIKDGNKYIIFALNVNSNGYVSHHFPCVKNVNDEVSRVSQYQKNNWEDRKKYNRNYYNKYSEKFRKIAKKYYRENRERILNTKRRWAIRNREQHLEIKRTNENKRRRGLDSIPLNVRECDGWVGHHITKDHIVYIPEELHRSVWHNVWSGRGMDEINRLVFKWVLGYKNLWGG